MAILFVY